jgi:GTP-binding protein Era
MKKPLPVILALNKIDLIDAGSMPHSQSAFTHWYPQAHPVAVSATQPSGLDLLLAEILENLKEGAPFFPQDQLTDLYERDIAADLIRESALIILRDEVPHGIAVRIDRFTERGDEGAYIEATLFVERESHKPIVIGEGGKMLKKIGTAARHEIESATGRKVYLNVKVKVRKNWRDDEKVLRGFGY